jgi:hypothetical protein
LPPSLSRLKAMDPRDVWKHEAYDFTPWLLDNADALAEVMGIDVDLTEAEHAVGGYSLDLVGQDLTNNCVLIIENQLTATDHGHLGQLVTYAAGTEARTVVWMATAFREEHRQAIDFLNSLGAGDVRFFGVEIGVVCIDQSPPAPLFKVVAQPNDWHSTVSTAAKASAQGVTGKGQFYVQFWQRFLERVRTERPGWTNAKKAGASTWLTMPSPFKGGAVNYSVSFALGGKLRNELYIGSADPDANLAMFEALHQHKTEVEAAFGGPLSWEDLPGKKACRVAIYGEGDVAQVEEHDAYVDWFITTGTKLRHALEPFASAAAESSAAKLVVPVVPNDELVP